MDNEMDNEQIDFEKDLPQLPQHLKNILRISGYFNLQALKEISDQDIEQIEKFSQEELPHLIEADEYENYYGVYKKVPNKFKILPGHKKLLLSIPQQFQSNKVNPGRKSKEKTKIVLQVEGSELGSELCSTISQKSSKGEKVIVDLNEEKKSLKRELVKTVKAIVEENTSTKSNSNILTNLANTEVTVKIGHNEEMYATVKCFLCSTSIKLYFEKQKANYAPRWLRGNFYKHVRTHLKDKGIQGEDTTAEPKRKKIKTIASYFKKDMADNTRPNIRMLPEIQKQPEERPENQSILVDTEETCDEIFDLSVNDISEDRGEDIPQDVPSDVPNSENFDEYCIDEDDQQPSQQQTLNNLEGEGIVIHQDVLIQKSKLGGKRENQPQIKKTEQKSERAKRRLLKISQDQPFITSFFKYINEAEKVIEENIELKKLIFKNCDKLTSIGESAQTMELRTDQQERYNVKNLLNLIAETAFKNRNESSKGNKYDKQLKKFCAYIFIIGGRLLYETLISNLKGALPSIPTVLREFSQHRTFEEGKPRILELQENLEKRNLRKLVWLSEDATRINGRIQYCPATNTNVGFVLPLNSDGYPNNKAFKATSVQESKANYAYALVAQPLEDRSFSFCYCIYGSDNRFNANDVLKRWRTTVSIAKAQGIAVLGMSSDGDSRLLKVMKYMSKLSSAHQISKWPWFRATVDPEIICVQDTIHIGTKLRSRLIKPNILLPFGNFCVSVDHLRYLLCNFDKGLHFLVETDLDCEDKMNFASVLKICDTKVIELLKTEVMDSNATVLYLTIIKGVLDAYLQKDMTVEDRLYNLWYCVFILRIWRQWIKQSDSYTLKNNFVTLNSYTCIEINAHAIISLIKKFSSDESLTTKMFTPWPMSSQPCEQLFRATRSMTSTYSTVVNYSMLEILNRLNRIHYLEDVKTELQGQFSFPRSNTDTDQLATTFQPMTDENIEITVLKAQKDAVSNAECMGIIDAYSSTFIFDLPEIKDLDCDSKDLDEEPDCDLDDNIVEHYEDSSYSIQNILEDNEKNDIIDSPSEDVREYLESYKGSLTLKDFTGKKQKPSEDNNSRFLKVVLQNGSIKTFKKSSLCWFFNENSKLSTDRLERFETNKNRKTKVRGGMLKTSKQNTSRKPKSHITKNQAKNAPSTSRRNSSSSQTSTESDSNDFSCNDSTEISDINSEKEEECDKQKINILNEHYYAVMYGKIWYIGKVVNYDQENLGENIQIKFLKEDLEDFYWPRQDDLQLIEPIQIIYGPITMVGTHPMKLSRSDRLKIQTLHKSLKKTI